MPPYVGRRRLETPSNSRRATGSRRVPGPAKSRTAVRSASAMAGVVALVGAAVGSTFTTNTTDDFTQGPDARPAAFAYTDDYSVGRSGVDVSRGFDRELIAAQTKAQVAQRAKALEQLDDKVQTRSQQLENERRNQWVLPVTGYRLTARFGQSSSLWSSGSHTGLDFAGPSGTPIKALAAGTVTSAGYDGSYGYRTIITLLDGTEIWYCHQSRITVSAGEKVEPGELTGYTGSTGNVTGAHLHLEVRPDGGRPVDPEAALQQHGVRP